MKPKNYINKNELSADFKKNGYVSVKSAFDLTDISYIAKSIENALKIFCKNDLDYHTNIISLNNSNKEQLYKFNFIANGLISNFVVTKNVDNILSMLNNGNPMLGTANGASMGGIMFGLPKDDRLAYNFHQESSYMRGAERIYNVHFPIFVNSTKENGTMSLLEGSNVEGQLPFTKYRKYENSYTDLIPNNITYFEEKYTEVFAELDLGDCIIFDEYTIHKSNYNNTDLCRTVAVWRIFGNSNANAPILKPADL